VTRVLLIALLAASLPLHAGEPRSGRDCEEATTVFHDVSRIGRKDRAAANMTRRHAEMAERGWRFVDSAIYTENGDLEGLFLTYVRPVACPEPGPARGD
jgi:hypothetical protein